jgi:hypothetical protein
VTGNCVSKSTVAGIRKQVDENTSDKKIYWVPKNKIFKQINNRRSGYNNNQDHRYLRSLVSWVRYGRVNVIQSNQQEIPLLDL